MTRKLKVTYSRSSECEVTGRVNSNDEHAVIELDGATVGDRIFPQSDIEWLDGNLKLERITPNGVVIATKGQTYIVTEGDPYRTGTYTLDGRHNWRYTFEITDE